MNFLARSITVAAIAALTGCAANVTRPSNAPKVAISPAATRHIVLTLTGTPEVVNSADWGAFREEWQTSMGAATSSNGARFTLAEPGAPLGTAPATLVRVKVNDYRYVTQAKRYGLGVITGNAFMDLDVDFLELPSQRSVGSRKFTTSSSAWQGIFSAMTPKQVEAVSTEIVNEVTAR